MIAHMSSTAIKQERCIECNHHSVFIFLFVLFALTVPASLLAGVTLLKSENGGAEVVLRFDNEDYTLNEVLIKGEPCVKVELNVDPYTPYTKTIGFPALPYLTTSIAIPGTAAMGLEIVSQNVKEIRVNKIVPSKGPIKRTIDLATVPYTFGDIYDKDEWYPLKTVTLGEPYILNAVRGNAVTFYPFQYNAKSGVLKITTSIVVRVKQTGTSAVNVLSTRSQIITPAFANLYEQHFINFGGMRRLYSYVPDGEKMIIITPSSLKGAVQPLVDWKNQKGIATTVYEYPSQTGGNGHSALTNFLKGKYASDKMAYIILVGDDKDIPAPSSYDALSDPSYTRLNGNDNYPDAFIGRLCSSKSDGIAAIVKKTINYEKFPDPTGDWYQKAVGIGSEEQQNSAKSDQDWIKQYRSKMLSYGYTTVDEFYSESASKTALINALNKGRSWLNYMGHGGPEEISTSGFSNYDISKLTNKNMPTIWISIACNNGEYSNTCIAEAMTCAADKGALVYSGSFTEQDWTAPQGAMTEMIEQLLLKDKCLSVGAIFYNGDCKMLEIGEPAAKETFFSWIYFGDPSVMHFTKTPKAITVTPLPINGLGEQQVQVNFDAAIVGHVALYDSIGKRLLGSRMMLEKATSATIAAKIPEDIRSVTLTVTAFNRITNIQDVEIHTGPYVSVKLDSLCYWVGDNIPVKWVLGGGANITNVKLEYTTDGKTFTTIVPSISASGCSYTWTIPDMNETDSCKIKVSEVGGSLNGISPPFTIKQKPHIAVAAALPKELKPNDSAVIDLKIANTGKGRLSFAITSGVGGSGNPKILINEIYAGDAGIDGVELWNQAGDMNMEGWKVTWKDNKSSSNSFTFPSGVILKHNKTLVVMDIQNQANDSNAFAISKNIAWSATGTELAISLLDKNGMGVDFVRTSGNSDAPPSGTEWIGDGIKLDQGSAYRVFGIDHNALIDWKSSYYPTENVIDSGQSLPSPGGVSITSRLADTIRSLDSTTIRVKFNSKGLDEGNYFDTITIAHNDPDKVSPCTVICKLKVTPNPVEIASENQVCQQALSLYYRQDRSAVYFTTTGPFTMMKTELRIFDLLGHLVYHQAGERIAPWRYENRTGTRIARGMYFAVLKLYDRDRFLQSRTFLLGVR